ncbi:VPA1269 family protein [Aliiroseovarius crassostreae]|uniref:VPA1269 family protein n=1 Tax=Aliiroseovarius crassostreae TaxID=154981 RepID=UPI00220E4CE8|nr:VPA1269 family protein [Aliiroseovarius crassostreae]UWP88444.1 hypothetical protein K3J57_11130 [Aliiroseovarius crassostreae]
MAVLRIDDHLINSSSVEFHAGNATQRQLDDAEKALNKFRKHADAGDISAFMKLHEETGALYPTHLAIELFRNERRAYRTLCDEHDFFRNDRESLLAYTNNQPSADTINSNIRRILLGLHLSSTARSLRDVSEEVWAAFVRTLKTDNGRWKNELGVHDGVRRAFSALAQYMNTNYPSKRGFDKPVLVPRQHRGGNKTGFSSKDISDPPREFKRWIAILEEYRSGPRKSKGTKQSNAYFYYFMSWLSSYPEEEFRRPEVFLSEQRANPSWESFVVDKIGPKNSAAAVVRYVADMIDWFISEKMVAVDEDGNATSLGFPVLMPAERKRFDDKARDWSPTKRNQAASPPLPRRWLKVLQEILTEDDWAWPKSLDSHYFETNRDGRVERIWNPVIPFLVYTMTELPWRKIQVKSLDSGEGDLEMLDLTSGKWVRNTSVAAGFWERHEQAHRKRRGVLNRDGEDFCFYVNTNKTSDSKHGFGEMSGYLVPWKYTPMIELFQQLKSWQETYNPIELPTPYMEAIEGFEGVLPPEGVIDMIPDRFYLFRDFNGRRNRVSPPTDNKLHAFWRLLMDELERRLNAQGEDAVIVLSRNASGGPMTAQYTMHGLRVAGLTAFAEAGVPIEVLSKLVAGHASVLMTIYYLKYNTAHVTDILESARLKFEALEARDFANHLKSRSIEEAAKIAVANEDYTLVGVADGSITTDLFFDTGLGVCPFGGSSCHDGVDLGNGRKAAVPGGSKNCLQCRHFISGEPWLTPLVLNQQRLAAKAQSLSKKHNTQLEELDDLVIQRTGIIKNGGVNKIPPLLKRQIAQLENEIERHADDLDCLLSTMHQGHRLIEQIKYLQALPNEEGLPVLVADAGIEVRGYREGTRFELIDSILQGSRIYPVLKDDDLETERERFIDVIMFNNGMTPLSMMSLSNEQSRQAADAASEWLIRKVGAQQTNLLHSGAQTLEEMGFSTKEMEECLLETSVTAKPPAECRKQLQPQDQASWVEQK